MTARGIMIAAPSSRAGKTSLTIGALRALARRGVRVGAAKLGPDYIDPGFHRAAIGRPSPNLDTWAMPPRLLDQVLSHAAESVDLLLLESAMGLFDGAIGSPGRSGAASELAARYRVPVVLVLDVSGQSQTAAAVVRGLASHEPGVRIVGAVLGRVGSPRHRQGVAEAVERVGTPVLGALPRDASLALPSRHLGLVQAEEQSQLEARIERLADAVERHVDLSQLVALAEPLSPLGSVAGSELLPCPGRRIALAVDSAFSFTYPHLLASWRSSGASVLPFSPLADEPPPESCDSCWLPGGYPELHALRLASAKRFLEGLRHFARTRPVHGECGGYMVLGRHLRDASGTQHPMAGLLDHSTSFAERRLHLGYRRAVLRADGVLGRRGSVVRGHEFHYTTVETPGSAPPLADVFDAQGQSLGALGAQRGQVSGSFFHLVAGED